MVITHFIRTIIPCAVQLISYIFMGQLSSYPTFNATNMQRNSQLAAILQWSAPSSVYNKKAVKGFGIIFIK